MIGDALKDEFEKEFYSKIRHLDSTALISPIEWKVCEPEPTTGTFVKDIPLGKNVEAGDISISVSKSRIMTIEVIKERGGGGGQLEGPGGSLQKFREYGKMFVLPKTVDLSQLTSILQDNGNLRVEAPYQKCVEEADQ